jgi:ribose transport system ATP-binding protein
MALAALPGYARAGTGWIDEKRLAAEMGRYREAVRLTSTARNEQAVKTLSGGNQQKVVLAKWLLTGPRVFVLDEPTRGIDVGAKSEIYGLIHALAGRGAGILIISSEIEELIGLCDRILVMRRGELSDELEGGAFDRERILRSAMDDTTGRGGGEMARGAR